MHIQDETVLLMHLVIPQM